jgi:serine/threonine protein kinase
MSMAEFDPERDPIDVLAEEFTERCRRGEQPSVSEYTTLYPEWASQLRELLPSVALMERLKRLKQPVFSSSGEESKLQQLGDYRILREVGRGGMGIVYEAVQESLGRRVALKVLPRHALLDGKKRDRFQREAQAAARLHHTNIVPVFGIGEQDGLPYYAMQYIDGKGLNEVVAEFLHGAALTTSPRTTGLPAPVTPANQQPGDKEVASQDGRSPGSAHPGPSDPPARGESHWETVARIGVQAAQALDHAHNQGTLHRDVKPANLLLDQQGTIWVTDFGLAKMVPVAADEGGRNGDLTDTGDILGTLQYLAPECLQGQADARSDIYSLGLTLYELLTLQAPFRETHPAKLLKQVSDQEPPRPRKVNRAIPRDLETIILKAIAREPERRYQTAGALAEDLERFLEDRPIQARRTRPLEKLWRWCRRNRAVAALTVTTLALILLAAAFGWVGYVNTRAALKREEEQGRQIRLARQQAEENVQLSLGAFEDIFGKLAQGEKEPVPRRRFGGWPDGASTPPAVSEKEAALLRSILHFYDRFAAKNATHSGLEKEAARAHRRVGEIYQRLGQLDKAETSYLQAARILEKLVDDFPTEADYRYHLAVTYSLMKPRGTDARALAEAEKRLHRAADLAEDLARQSPKKSDYVSLAARTRSKMASILEQQKREGAAETAYRQAIVHYQALVKESASSPLAAYDLAGVRYSLAKVLLRREQPQKARTILEESVADLRDALNKSRPRFRRGANFGLLSAGGLLVNHYEALAETLKLLGEKDRAAEASRKAQEVKRMFKSPPLFGVPFGGPRGKRFARKE